MNANAITVIVVTASAILNFLLTQPPNTFSPTALLVIGAASIGLTTVSRFLPTQGSTQKVEITGAVATTTVVEDPTPNDPPAPDDDEL
jgi:hypothetical protein